MSDEKDENTDFPKGGLQRMSIATSGDEEAAGDVEEQKSYFGYVSDVVFSKSGSVALLSCIVVIFFALMFLRSTYPSPSDEMYLENSRQMYHRPRNLRNLIRKTTENARKLGSLASLSISPPQFVTDNGIEFLVSHATTNRYDSKEKAGTIAGSAPVISTVDPFDVANIDKNMIIADIDPGYTLVLNKFNTIPDHSLLVTKKFLDQSSPLTDEDLEAWFWCLDSSGSAGFYNSALDAGASQKHKHMQLIPLDVVASMRPPQSRYALPVEEAINPKIRAGQWLPYRPNIHGIANERQRVANVNGIYQLEEYEFKHAVAVLFDPVDWEETNRRTDYDHQFPTYGVYLEQVYKDLLHETGIHQPPCDRPETTFSASSDGGSTEPYCLAYNLILTSRWMMVVPRSTRDYDQKVGVNGFGFVGMLLARDEVGENVIKAVGPLQVLKTVTLPR